MSTTTNAIDFDGLRKVVEAVRKANNDSLDMGTWIDTDARTCGFAGCAIGWHCHVNTQDELKMDDDAPTFGDKAGWSAVEARFGLTPQQADKLFSIWSYEDDHVPQTPENVVARLEQFIRDHEST